MKYDVALDSMVSVEVDGDPDYDSNGEPLTNEETEAYRELRRKAKEAFIAMLESDMFDLAYEPCRYQ